MTRRIVLVFALALTLIAGSGAWATRTAAHAKLKESFPVPEAVIGAAPAQVLLTFSQETSPTKSGGVVTDAAGAVVSAGFRVNLARRTQATIDLKPMLPPGAYTVRWNSFTDDDGGVESGTFAFTVRSGAPLPVPPAEAVPAAPAAAAPPTDTGVPVGLWLLLAVAVLAGGAVAARIALLRRRV